MVLEKTLESPLDSKEIKTANPEENQQFLFFGRTESGRRRGRQRVRWLDGINGYQFEKTPGDSEGQQSLACYSPWGCKESDTTW